MIATLNGRRNKWYDIHLIISWFLKIYFNGNLIGITGRHLLHQFKFFDNTLTFNCMGSRQRLYFQLTNQRWAHQYQNRAKCWELLFNWSTYLTVLHMIGWFKMNERAVKICQCITKKIYNIGSKESVIAHLVFNLT